MSVNFAEDLGGVITDPRFWASRLGYEFWINVGHQDPFSTMSASNDGLSGYGWTCTSLAVTEGVAGDFGSAADIDPTRIILDATGDTLTSPSIFGNDAHGKQAARFLGYIPTKLCCEFFAAFTVNTANELGTWIGFNTPAAVTDPTAAGGGPGAIVSDGTNFRLRSDNGNDAGAAKDNAWHIWRIEVMASTVEWFIDDVSQGTITTETDIFPCFFGMRCTTTNRIAFSWGRVWYQ